MSTPTRNCKFCDKKGLWIYLQRYAVIVSDNGEGLADLPALAGNLGRGVTDLALGPQCKYAVRLLRDGYVYVLVERLGVRYWQGYLVVENCFLYQFDVESPPVQKVEFTCDRTSCGIGASVVAIDDVEAVSHVWLLFAPTAMTKAKLDEYRINAPAYAGVGKLQHFDPKGWVHGSTNQPHTLKPEKLMSTAAEFRLYRQQSMALVSPLGLAMKRQMFEAASAAYAGTPPQANGNENGYLGVLAQRLEQQKGAVFALYDPIGITQELNDFRNAPLEGLEHYLAATDEYGASNQQRLQVYEAIEEVKAAMCAGIVNDRQEFLKLTEANGDRHFEQRRSQAKLLRAQGRTAEADAIDADVDRALKVRPVNFAAEIESAKAGAAENWRKKYESRLDTSEMGSFQSTFSRCSNNAFDKASARAIDHLKWLEADRVVNAFDLFDKADPSSGYSFAVETSVCSFGLASCKLGEDKIDAWIKAPQIERKNLYMRGFYFNNDTLTFAAKQAFADIRAVAGQYEYASDISAAVMLKATKGLVDSFKKADSAFDEWARNQGQKYSLKWAGGREIQLYHKLSDITRCVFRAGLGGRFDKALTATLSGLLYARLGQVTETLAFDEAMLRIPKDAIARHRRARNEQRAESRRVDKASVQAAKTAAQVDGSLEALIADAQAKTREKVLSLNQTLGTQATRLPTNNYHQTRLGVILGCIEMIALGEKLSHFENTSKGWLEVVGSTLAVGSIVLDTHYSAAKSIREILPFREVQAINRGADIVRGGFKLGAGTLGMGAAWCGAYLDYAKFENETSPTLKFIYGVRSVTGFISGGLTLVVAFSYCQPLIKHAAAGWGRHSSSMRLLSAAGKGAGLLSARMRLLVWVVRLNWIGLALTVAEIGYLALKDDDLQNWCEKSIFRKNKKSKSWLAPFGPNERFGDAAKELEELDRATHSLAAKY